MGVLARLFGRETKALGDDVLSLLRQIYGGLESATGETITWRNAAEVTAVLRCCAVIAEGVSTVPLRLMRKDAGNRRAEATDHPLAELLHWRPNDFQNSLEFRDTIVFHMALTGNAFVYVSRVGRRVVELLPIEPGAVTVKQNGDWTLTYTVTLPDGTAATLGQADIWHLRLWSWNAWMGLQPVQLARDAIGLSRATERAHAKLHQNGIRPSGAWTVEGTLQKDQHDKLREWLKQTYAGVDATGLPLIMDRAAKWQPMTMNGVDAQHVETRRLQIEEICRAFGVMPIMVGFSDKASTYASAEQMFLAHAVHTIRPWHRRLEASINTSLLTAEERASGLYAKFFDAELLRGAAKDRGEFYSRALGAGGSPAWMEINEVRGFEDMDAVPWGDGQPVPPNAPREPTTGGQPDGAP